MGFGGCIVRVQMGVPNGCGGVYNIVWGAEGCIVWVQMGELNGCGVVYSIVWGAERCIVWVPRGVQYCMGCEERVRNVHLCCNTVRLHRIVIYS